MVCTMFFSIEIFLVFFTSKIFLHFSKTVFVNVSLCSIKYFPGALQFKNIYRHEQLGSLIKEVGGSDQRASFLDWEQILGKSKAEMFISCHKKPVAWWLVICITDYIITICHSIQIRQGFEFTISKLKRLYFLTTMSTSHIIVKYTII